MTSELRFGIDQCDSQWICGWADSGGDAVSLRIFLNEKFAGEIFTAFFRPDLRDHNIGDGCRGFKFWLGGHTVAGHNRVSLRFQEEEIFSRSVLAVDVHPESPRKEPSLFQKPRFGERVIWPRIAVAANFGSLTGTFSLHVAPLERVLQGDYSVEPLWGATPFKSGSSDLQTLVADVPVPDTIQLPKDCALIITRDGSPDVMDATWVHIAEVPAETFGKAVTPGISEDATIIGPLLAAKSNISDLRTYTDLHLDLVQAESAEALVQQPDAGLAFFQAYAAADQDATGAFLADLSYGHDLPEFQKQAQRLNWKSNAAYFIRLDEVSLFPDYGITIFRKNRIWSDSIEPAVGGDRTFSRIPGWFSESDALYAALPSRPRYTMHDSPIILFLSYNYSHWLQNSISAAWHALQIFGKQAKFILPGHTSEVMRQSLNLLGIDAAQIISVRDSVVDLDRAIYPSFINTHSNMFPSPHNIGAITHLKESNARLGDICETPRRIFICRREGQVASPRILENEVELGDALRKLGFVSVFLHKLSFNEQVRLFSKAEIIIGQLGAGLVNAVFAPAGCAIIELSNDTIITNEFLWLASLHGHRYVRIMAASNMARSRTDFTFRVPVDVVTSIARQLM